MRVNHKKQLVVALAATAWSGCGGEEAARSSGDAGVDTSLSVPDAGYGDAGAGPCSARLAGSEPFGAHLEGSGTFYDKPLASLPSQFSVALDIYFPGGRVAGGPVLVAMPLNEVVPVLRMGGPSVLATDLSATGLQVGGLGVGLSGTLLPGDDGLSANVWQNLGSGDLQMMASGVTKLCPTGPAPTPNLALGTLIGADVVAPTSTVLLATSTPIDAGALAKIRLFAGDAEVPVAVRVGTAINPGPDEIPALVLSANAAFPPETPLRLDTTGVTDILGRAVLSSDSLPPLTTTGVVSDLTFATAPTAAVTSLGIWQVMDVTDGMLALHCHYGPQGGYYALFALGSVAPATQARLRIGVDCAGTTPTTHASLVGVAGDAATVPLACGPPQDLTLPLPPSTGNIWLSVVCEPPVVNPYWGYFGYSIENLQIDEIAFK